MVEPKPIWKKYAQVKLDHFHHKSGWQFPPTYLKFYHLDLVIVGSGCHELPWKWTDFCFSDFPTPKNNATQPARRVVRQPLQWTRGIYMIYTSNLASFLNYFHQQKTCIVLWKNRDGQWLNQPSWKLFKLDHFPKKNGLKIKNVRNFTHLESYSVL